ncbi:hypothetical protein GGI07_005490 [Coemansia sp. Benny D115]|nr:hypothetical protein GGI07_005490 [Coemansia sp. Benny D115]
MKNHTRIPEHSTLTEDIAASLRALPSGSRLSLRTLCTADEYAESLTPQRRHPHFHSETTTSRRILVLVSQDGCLVAGLEAREFVTIVAGPRQATKVSLDATIEKVDTTGHLATRMPLVRALVLGYIRSLRRYRRALDTDVANVHLFARAQPEYLFAQSEDNPNKHTLDDLALVKWWYATLDAALGYAARGNNGQQSTTATADTTLTPKAQARARATPTAHCIIPGVDASEAPWFSGHDTAVWSWGLPYPAKERAHDHVLQFPDDPAARLLAKPHTDTWSVAALVDMLALSEECGAGRRAAFFSISVPFGPAPAHREDAQDGCSAEPGRLTSADFSALMVALFKESMDFSTLNAARVSSERLDAFIASRFTTTNGACSIFSADIDTQGPALVRAQPVSAAQPVAANDMTTLVRKKRKVAN